MPENETATINMGSNGEHFRKMALKNTKVYPNYLFLQMYCFYTFLEDYEQTVMLYTPVAFHTIGKLSSFSPSLT